MTLAKRIAITGAAGQDGLILGLKLVAAGHIVTGIVRSADQKSFLELYNPKIKAEILEFIEIAFRTVGISDWGRYLRTGKTLSRPADVYSAVGDNSKAKQPLNWHPTTTFEEIVTNMVIFDVKKLNHRDKPMYWRPGDHA